MEIDTSFAFLGNQTEGKQVMVVEPTSTRFSFDLVQALHRIERRMGKSQEWQILRPYISLKSQVRFLKHKSNR